MMLLTSYSMFKEPHNIWTLKLFQGSEKLVYELSRFYSFWKNYGARLNCLGEKILDSDSYFVNDSLQNLVGKLHKHLTYNIGMIAYKLILTEPYEDKVKEDENDSEDVKKAKKIRIYRE